MSKLLSLFRSPVKMKLYFLKKIPSLYFWGVKIESIDSKKAEVSIPFGWRTQNPFRSIYFSALAGAAELSSGLLALLAIEKQNVSMLVVGMEAKFTKKANTKTVFICNQGEEISQAVHRAVDTGEGQEVAVIARGFNSENEIVAEFKITWSFKKR